MNNDSQLPIADARVLAAMRAVNPPIEKLMTDRLSLRIEFDGHSRNWKRLIARRRITVLREVQIPRTYAAAKFVSLAAASILLVALINALFLASSRSKPQASPFLFATMDN
jgi:hypothetical protein